MCIHNRPYPGSRARSRTRCQPRLAPRFYQLKTGHRLTGQHLQWTNPAAPAQDPDAGAPLQELPAMEVVLQRDGEGRRSLQDPRPLRRRSSARRSWTPSPPRTWCDGCRIWPRKTPRARRRGSPGSGKEEGGKAAGDRGAGGLELRNVCSSSLRPPSWPAEEEHGGGLSGRSTTLGVGQGGRQGESHKRAAYGLIGVGVGHRMGNWTSVAYSHNRACHQ